MSSAQKTAGGHRTRLLWWGLDGAAAWTAYGIVECWVVNIIPWLLKPAYGYRPWHRGFTALLFVVYPVSGFVLGALAGLLARPAAVAAERIRIVATLTLTGVYAANSLSLLPLYSTAIVVPLVNAVLLAFLLIWATGPSRLGRSFRLLAYPMISAAILVGVPWMSTELLQTSYAIKAAVASGCWIAILTICLIAERSSRHRAGLLVSTGMDNRPRALVPLAATAIVTLVASGLPGQSVQTGPASQNLSPVAKGGPVILISLDTVRADHLSIHGYGRDTTPHLERLLEDSTLYTQAVSASDMTLGSHASIFTGQYPSWHGAYCRVPDYGLGRPLAPRFETLAEILGRSGYRTFGVVANYGYLGHHMGLAQGFHYYDDSMPVRFLARPNGRHLRAGVRALLAAAFGSSRADLPYRAADEINQQVLPLLDRISREEARFFLFVNYMDAHWPYRPPPPFDARYPGKIARLLETDADFIRLTHEILGGQRAITLVERRHLESQYDGAIAYLDLRVGEVLARLKQLKLYDQSLIIVTSDHGEAFGDRNLVEHGVSVYQDQVRVPLIIKFPNTRRRQTNDGIVSGVDLLPTILDVVGVAPPNVVQGRSLFQQKNRLDRAVLSESFPDSELHGLSPRFQRVQRALFAEGLKLIASTTGDRELYDVAHDQDETANLAVARTDVAVRLEASLIRWLQAVVQDPGARESIDPGTLERLKALGYLR